MKVRQAYNCSQLSQRQHFIGRNVKTHMRKGQSDIRANLSVSISVISFSLFAHAEQSAFFSSSLEIKRVLKLCFCPSISLFFLTVLRVHLAFSFKTNIPSKTPATRLKLFPFLYMRKAQDEVVSPCGGESQQDIGFGCATSVQVFL